jgi:probable rRNA maturation factor
MGPESSALIFQHPARKARRGELRAFWAQLSKRVAGGRGMTCLIATDRELRRLNREFRAKDYATDVLSFPGSAEIAISYDRAEAQAAELGHGVEDELRILMLHGVLHLMGLDHENDSGEMARREALWRKRFRLPVGLIERASL